MFEKGLREKVAQENTSVRCELGKLQQQLKVRGGGTAPPGSWLLGLRKPLPRAPAADGAGRELCVWPSWSASAGGVTEPGAPESAKRGWQVMDKQASLAPRPSGPCSSHLPAFRAAHLGAGRGLLRMS